MHHRILSLLLATWLVNAALAQEPMRVRIEQLQQELDLQHHQLMLLQRSFGGQVTVQSASHHNDTASDCDCRDRTQYVPVVGDARTGQCDDCGQPETKSQHVVTHYVGYDKGFTIRPFNRRDYPFDLKFNGRIQLRHHGFARDAATWTDNAGVTREILNRNAFDVERARLLLSGTVLDPRMSFFLQLDGDSDGNHGVDFFDYWFAWQLTENIKIQFGKRKVSASRNWLLGAFDTMFVDRPMATDFFRPDRTLGVWAVGKIGQRSHYELMIGNGYRTSNLSTAQINDKLAGAFSHWMEIGDEAFGSTYADYEMHQSHVARFGHSFVAAAQSDTSSTGVPIPESGFVRLTDGTVLTASGALAPGSRVNAFDIYMVSVDAAWKYNGFSLQGEYFLRWIDSISGTGPIPLNKLFDRGFFVQGSLYLIPKKVYVAGRISQIKGQFGDHYEYSAAVNWFVLNNRNFKVTFDVTTLDGSPLSNTTSDILAGDDGVLFRTQVQARF